jgi:small subunit ribosomal protein S4
MARYTGPKVRLSRRLSTNIFENEKGRKALDRRPFPPGAHGRTRRRNAGSEYLAQLQEKQKAKAIYGLLERQFRKTYEEAARMKGDTSENLIGLLESRLDAIVYRAKFVPTPFAARQFVNHGHVKVNGKRVTIPSYRCKVGDVIEVREKSKQMGLVLESIELAERDIPDYVEADHSKMTARYVRQPVFSDVPYPVVMEPNLVIEFYSR